ncbi:MAG: AmpG family muropeptide MFS transporter [Desulfobacteraceae bacterium]
MLTALIMGFACGLPLLLTLGLLQAWMKEEGIDLSVIGLTTLVGIPYTLKFIWAPLFDRYTLPFLGRRRGAMLITQLALMAAILLLAASGPDENFYLMVLAAFLVAFFSASQDIVVDAYRREDLADQELGLGSSLYVNGYRCGMLLASGGGLILADHMSFPRVYMIMAACMLPAVLTTLMTPEPPLPENSPKTMKEAVIDPLKEYFSRKGALWILIFVLMYKIGDAMASAITTPFYLDVGFTKTHIGTVVKLFGTSATLIGLLLGGLVLLSFNIYRCLWIFGILQSLSTASFAILAQIGPNIAMLSGVIAFENLSSGMGTAAYAAFMASITNKRFTATQYALLSSLMGIPRVVASAPTGFMAKFLGWETFFIFCALIAIPGLLLINKIVPKDTTQ